jgi:DNA repair protein RadC
MTKRSTPYPAICDAVASRDRSDGGLLAIFLNRRRDILLTIEISEGTHHIDELFLRHLVTVITDIGVADVVLAITRATGRPARVDKLLWHEIGGRLATTATGLLDVIVVGESRWWSAATGRVQSLALTSSDAR